MALLHTEQNASCLTDILPLPSTHADLRPTTLFAYSRSRPRGRAREPAGCGQDDPVIAIAEYFDLVWSSASWVAKAVVGRATNVSLLIHIAVG